MSTLGAHAAALSSPVSAGQVPPGRAFSLGRRDPAKPPPDTVAKHTADDDFSWCTATLPVAGAQDNPHRVSTWLPPFTTRYVQGDRQNRNPQHRRVDIDSLDETNPRRAPGHRTSQDCCPGATRKDNRDGRK